MKKLSLGARMFWVITLFALAATGIAVRSVIGMEDLKDVTTELVNVVVVQTGHWREMRDDLRVLALRERILIHETNAAEQAKLIADLDEYYQRLHASLAMFMETANAEGIDKGAQFTALMDQWFNVNLQIREAKAGGKLDEALRLASNEGRVIGEQCNRFIDEMIEANNVLMKQATEHAQFDFERARNSMILFSLLAMAVGSVLGIYVLRSVTGSIDGVIMSLNANSSVVTEASGQIASSAESLSQASTEQAAALEETAASIEELNQMVQRNLELAKNAVEVSSVSQGSAQKGQQVVDEMTRAIGEIDQSNAKIMAQVEEGNRQIGEITKVISEIGDKTKVINDIVFQTKLLSFNASVEAARAGEHGKGFAVVAEEVGNLAQMSGTAAKEISTMLDDSIRKVEGIVNNTRSRVESLIQTGKEKVEVGTRIAEECNSVLGEIVVKVSEVSSMSQNIASASEEQALGVEQISLAMQQLDQVTQSNATSAEKSAEAAERLSIQAETLKNLINTLSEIVRGKKGARSAKKASTDHSHIDRFKPDSHASSSGPAQVISIKKATAKAKSEAKHSLKPDSSPHSTSSVATHSEPSSEPKAVASSARKAAGSSELAIPSEDDPRFKDI
jgi:methyl-accepting chemotaxis protein